MNDEDKTLSLEEFRNIYVENATVGWLKSNGLNPEDPSTNAVELDESNEDSQLYAWMMTAQEAFDFFMETLSDLNDRGYEVGLTPEEQEEGETENPENIAYDFFGENLGNGGKSYPQASASSSVHKSGVVFVFLENTPGAPKYVGDVREWLAEVDSLGIPDDTEVDGQLYLDYDISLKTSERSECLHCGSRDDILLTVHDCSHGVEVTQHQPPALFDMTDDEGEDG